MQLTTQQLATLKAWVVSNAAGVFEQSTLDLLNATAAPDYYIFKDTVDLFHVMGNGYDWTVVDNETVGQARIWDRMLEMVKHLGGISPWKITVLRGVGEAYKGTSPATVVAHRRNILQNHFPRKCRVWEKLYVTAAADWNVGSNADKTGARGAITNPDVMPLDEDGLYLSGELPLSELIRSDS